jgi:hypothetical protein
LDDEDDFVILAIMSELAKNESLDLEEEDGDYDEDERDEFLGMYRKCLKRLLLEHKNKPV